MLFLWPTLVPAELPVYAMTKEGHKRVWNETFGIDVQSRPKFDKLWNTAQEVIDYFNNDYDELKKNFSWFKLNESGHRLLFHWGFNTLPGNYAPLVEQVRTCLRRSNVSNKAEEERKFWELLNKMNERRKTRLKLSITNILDNFRYAPAIAAIIHDLHILADYSTENVSGLPKLDDIRKDLINSFRTLAGTQPSEEIRSLELDFLSSVNSNFAEDNKTRAANIIDASKKYLPELMNERFKNRLAKMGIVIRCIGYRVAEHDKILESK